MIFIADKIPPELRRVVEFLNLQMDPAEVLAKYSEKYDQYPRIKKFRLAYKDNFFLVFVSPY